MSQATTIRPVNRPRSGAMVVTTLALSPVLTISADALLRRNAEAATRLKTRERRCFGCAQWLPAEAFHIDAGDPLLGRHRHCKACRSARIKRERDRWPDRPPVAAMPVAAD